MKPINAWNPNPATDFIFKINATGKCVETVKSRIIQILAWHDSCRYDVVIYVTTDKEVLKGKDGIAIECPIHNRLERLRFGRMCMVGARKHWHYKYHLLSRTHLNEIQIKFYADTSVKFNPPIQQIEVAQTQWVADPIYIITNATLLVETNGEALEPETSARILVDATCSQFKTVPRGGSARKRVLLVYDKKSGNLKLLDNIKIVNLDGVMEWARKAAASI